MNWQEILLIVIPIISFMGWIWSRLDKKFDKIDQRFEKMDQRFDKIEHTMDQRFEKIDQRFEKMEHTFDQRIEKMDSELKDIRTSLNRMEGAFYSKDCCMLKDDKDSKKAN